MDQSTPVPSQRVFELADSAIGRFLEFRDQHGYGEDAARSLAVSEVMDAEAARAELDPDERRRCTCLHRQVRVLVTIGVDTHVDVHVAVALDAYGRRLGALTVATTPAGYGALLAWASRLGMVACVGLKAPGASGPGSAAGCRPVRSL